MRLSPHPSLRRLFAAGAVPARALARLTQTADSLTPLLRAPDDLEWPLAEALEPLLRGIDLSGLGRKATAAIDRDRARAAAPPHPKARRSRALHSHGDPTEPGNHPSASPGSPMSAFDPGNGSAVLRRYEQSIAGSYGDKRVSAGARGEDAAQGAMRPVSASSPRYSPPSSTTRNGPLSEAMPKRSLRQPSEHATAFLRGAGPAPEGARQPVSPADAIESMRRRAARAGDAAIADTELLRAETTAEVAGLLERFASKSDARRLAHVPPAGSAPAAIRVATGNARPRDGRDAIVRMVRVLEAFREPSRAPRRAPFIGGWPEKLRRVRLYLGPNPEDGPHEAASEPTEGGLRGLAVRASRSAAEDFPAQHEAIRPSDADFAERLDELLRNEARRQGINLEETER